MNSSFESLTERQRECADLIVENAIERRKDRKIKKLTQSELGEAVGVSDRTVRNWMKDPLFLAYLEYQSRISLQAAMPDFVAVLIANLEHGQNLSAKQMDMMMRMADWLPDQGSKGEPTSNQIDHSEIEGRIARIEADMRTKDLTEQIETAEAPKDGDA